MRYKSLLERDRNMPDGALGFSAIPVIMSMHKGNSFVVIISRSVSGDALRL